MCLGMILTKTKTREYHVVAYDPNWVRRYAVEEARLKEIFSAQALQIEHVGGTSVPGLSAQPAIDILVLLTDMGVLREHMRELAMLGYIDKGDFFDNGSRFFSNMGMVNLYIFPEGHEQAAALLHFRDYVRNHPELVEEHNNSGASLEVLVAEQQAA